MALTGLQIYKMLPKTNCGDCGTSTCLAFAMKLAGNKAALDECPHLSGGTKETLGAGSSPPIRQVTIGTGEHSFTVGNEKVLFRHEETFHNPTAIAPHLNDSLNEGELEEKIQAIRQLKFDRAGSQLAINAVALTQTSGEGSRFAACARRIMEETSLPLILISCNAEPMEEALKLTASARPLICGADRCNWEAMAELARKYALPLAVRGESLDEVAVLTEKLKATGILDLVIDPGSGGLAELIDAQTQIRRLALKKACKTLGYPTLSIACSEDPMEELMALTIHICKYVGISITSLTEKWQLFPLLTLRQNIFTNPQKPIQVEPKLYPIGAAHERSPLLVTTNFSLTYFLVAGEIEASKVPAWLLIVDTEGTSVLTAWAADKFNGEKIAKALKEAELEKILAHRTIVLPGYVGILGDSLKEASGWDVKVGPREASGIPSFLKMKGDQVA